VIKTGKIIVIGDEPLSLIAAAAGVDYYVFKHDCSELREFINKSIRQYDVVIYLSTIESECLDLVEYMKKIHSEGVFLMIEHPMEGMRIDPREYYRNIARRILGIEVEID